MDSYLKRLCVAVDQFTNSLIGGNPDVTLSSHVYTMAAANKSWRWLERFINSTFYPLDGPNHCKQAFANDNDEDATNNYVATAIVVTLACLVLWPIMRVLK